MKHKLKFLIQYSLKKKIGTKWFKAANIIIFVALIAMMNIDKIITLFGGDFKDEHIVYIVDQVNKYDLFDQYYHLATKDIDSYSNYKLEKTDKSIDALKEEMASDKNKIVIVLKPDPTNYLASEVISFEPINSTENQLFYGILNSVKKEIAISESKLSPEEMASLIQPIEMKTIVTNPDKSEDSGAKDQIANMVVLLFTVPFFFLITVLTQMTGAEINDEKTTRGMEIIISNVPAQIHFISKIVASTLFVIIQGLLLIVYSIIGIVISNVSLIGHAQNINFMQQIIQTLKDTGMLNLLISGGIVIFILFVFTFFAYAILAGVLASMTTSIEDYQQLQAPLMIILVIGYYIALSASVFEGALFIKIFAFIPMLSFLIAPAIYLLGQFSLLALILSTGITVIFTFLMYHYGLRIYKVGILNYSSKKLWRKIFRSLK